MSVSVCLCLCVCPWAYLRSHRSDLRHFLFVLAMAVAQSFFGGVAMLCTGVLWVYEGHRICTYWVVRRHVNAIRPCCVVSVASCRSRRQHQTSSCKASCRGRSLQCTIALLTLSACGAGSNKWSAIHPSLPSFNSNSGGFAAERRAGRRSIDSAGRPAATAFSSKCTCMRAVAC